MKRTLALLLAIVCASAAASGAGAKDLTHRVLQETDYGRQVAEACRTYCQGNQREGHLTAVEVSRMGRHLFAVKASARLLNQHWQMTPKALAPKGADGIRLFSYEMVVDLYARLDERDCVLTVERIAIQDDRLKLGRYADDLLGKSYRVEDCHRLLKGI